MIDKATDRVKESTEVIPEKVNLPFMYSTRNSITIACPRQDPLSTIPDENRGLVRKVRNAIVNFCKHGRFGDPFWSRYYD